MAHKKTIVELVQARDRAEKRVLRIAYRRGRHRHPDPLAVQLTVDLVNAALVLTQIDDVLCGAEREARREVKRLSK